MLKQVILYGIAAFIAYSIFRDGIIKGNLAKSLTIVKRIRPIMFVKNFLVQSVVVFVAMQLNAIPIINWGWWQLLDSGSEAGGSNANVAVTALPIFGPIILVALFVALPRLAEIEEEVFREGTTDWANGLQRSIIFGLAHCVMGVSIGIGLALSIAGMWYTRQYFKGGVVLSSAYHAAWNMTIIALVTYLYIS